MLKTALPLVFALLADGQLAGGADKPVATERSAPTPEAKEPAAAKRETKPAKPARDRSLPDRAEHNPMTGDAGKSLAIKEPPRKPGQRPEPERTGAPPSGLSPHALHEEMGARVGAQKAASERERLEALSTELARTRTALREETERLEAMMEKAKQGGGKPVAAAPAPTPPAPAPAAPAAPAARPDGGPPAAMPVGDPLAPSAYYRPVPPPPNFHIQVEVISRAMKSMKPEQAAGILGHLERGLAAEVLQRMRPADAGAILGFLKPEVGAALAAEIVTRPPLGRNKDKDPDKADREKQP